MPASIATSIWYPAWEPQLHAALVETDREKLKEKIAAAEDAIFARWQSMHSGDSPERDAMKAACRMIERLLIEKLGYPAGIP